MSKVVKMLKNNLFFAAIILAYIVLSFFSPNFAIQGIKNSGYYIKEMLMIMPVIFVLTALLDTFVPKETIIKYLGREAKTKGVLVSFVLGSISAGPIYAAFPFCVMLHKKGATVKNIVIVLSSWAVIKVPMLLNEAKFLGLEFMAVRWVLTIIAILIFSYIADKIIKDKDLPQIAEEEKHGVTINTDACMGCTICTKKYPELFEMESKKATIKECSDLDSGKLNDAIRSCPVLAIKYIK